MVLQCLQLCLHVLVTSLLVKPLLEFLSGSSVSATLFACFDDVTLGKTSA